jgi:hypothetical protein
MPRKQYYDKLKNRPGYLNIRNMTLILLIVYLFITLLDSRDILFGYIQKLNIDNETKTNMINKYIKLSMIWPRITNSLYILIIVVFLQQTLQNERIDYFMIVMLIFMFVMKKLICENQKPTTLQDTGYIRFCS